MGHPHWTPDQDMLSNCCGALSAGEIVDGDAICSKCGEHAYFDTEQGHEFWHRVRAIEKPYKPLSDVLKGEPPDPLTFSGLTKILFPDCNTNLLGGHHE